MTATYRLQLPPAFGFAEVETVLPDDEEALNRICRRTPSTGCRRRSALDDLPPLLDDPSVDADPAMDVQAVPAPPAAVRVSEKRRRPASTGEASLPLARNPIVGAVREEYERVH